MISRIAILGVVGALAACGRHTAPRGEAVSYRCADGIDVTASFTKTRPLEADLKHGADSWTLPLTPSGSGARYSDGKTTFWTKGNEALLEMSGKAVNCKAPDAPDGRS